MNQSTDKQAHNVIWKAWHIKSAISFKRDELWNISTAYFNNSGLSGATVNINNSIKIDYCPRKLWIIEVCCGYTFYIWSQFESYEPFLKQKYKSLVAHFFFLYWEISKSSMRAIIFKTTVCSRSFLITQYRRVQKLANISEPVVQK